MPAENLTPEFLHECFTYYPDFGWLIWKTRPLHHFKSEGSMRSANTQWAGKAAGLVQENGYRYVKVNEHPYPAHRLIWLMETGSWPDPEVDHIDGDYSNNRWENLREATHPENMKNRKLHSNNTSGHSGIYWSKRDRKWVAQIGSGSRNGSRSTRRNLGYYDTIEEAILARQAAEEEEGYHKNHGRR